MKKLMKKKVSMFGKEVSVFVIALVAVFGLASAALIPYFGFITGTVSAQQSVVLDDGTFDEGITDAIPEAAPGGEEFCFKHYLRNDASVPATVELQNSFRYEKGSWTTSEAGVTKKHYLMDEETTLELCEKGGTWTCVEDGASATLTFDPVNPRFVGNLTTSGLDEIEYALIYYADEPERFEDWGGENPGKVITTFTGNGEFTIDVNLGMNLPTEPDANIGEINYCDNNNGFDDYDHCYGAKLWIVPTSDLTGTEGSYSVPLTVWNPQSYLFETDLIMYSDSNIDELTSNYPLEEHASEFSEITIGSGEEVPFFNCYGFDIAIKPGLYEMRTDIVPVTE